MGSALRTYVSSRVPEMKEEDNAGVRIQETVLEILGKILGSSYGGGGDDKGSGRGLLVKPSKYKYLKERGGIEKDLNDKDKEPSASLKASLDAYDAEQVRALSLAWRELASTRFFIVSQVQKNKEKIEQPRGDANPLVM